MHLSPERIRIGSTLLVLAAALGTSACSAAESSSSDAITTVQPLEAHYLETPIHLQLVDTKVTGEKVDEEPEKTLVKDQYFDVLQKAGPAVTTEIIEAMKKATAGRYVPKTITTEKIPSELHVETCFDKDNSSQIKKLSNMLPKQNSNHLNIVVLNAEACATESNHDVAAFAVYNSVTVLARDAFVNDRFAEFITHEYAHQANSAPHSGVAVCENPAMLEGCSVDAEGNAMSNLGYAQGFHTPEEYDGRFTPVDLYKTNLLRASEIVSSPPVGTHIKLADVSNVGTKIIIDKTGKRTAYIVLGKEPDLSCAAMDQIDTQDTTYVANTVAKDSSDGTAYVCTSPQGQAYDSAVHVYFDADKTKDVIHAIDTGSASTAIVNTEPFITSQSSPAAKLLRPIARGYTEGKIYNSGTLAYEISRDTNGEFIVTVVAS